MSFLLQVNVRYKMYSRGNVFDLPHNQDTEFLSAEDFRDPLIAGILCPERYTMKNTVGDM